MLSGFKSLGHALVILARDDEGTLVVTPAWDAVRAAERCPVMRSIGADNVVTALQLYLEHHQVSPSRVATAGLAGMRVANRRTAECDVARGNAAHGQDGIWQRAAKTSDQLSKGPYGNADC